MAMADVCFWVRPDCLGSHDRDDDDNGSKLRFAK